MSLSSTFQFENLNSLWDNLSTPLSIKFGQNYKEDTWNSWTELESLFVNIFRVYDPLRAINFFPNFPFPDKPLSPAMFKHKELANLFSFCKFCSAPRDLAFGVFELALNCDRTFDAISNSCREKSSHFISDYNKEQIQTLYSSWSLYNTLIEDNGTHLFVSPYMILPGFIHWHIRAISLFILIKMDQTFDFPPDFEHLEFLYKSIIDSAKAGLTPQDGNSPFYQRNQLPSWIGNRQLPLVDEEWESTDSEESDSEESDSETFEIDHINIPDDTDTSTQTQLQDDIQVIPNYKSCISKSVFFVDNVIHSWRMKIASFCKSLYIQMYTKYPSSVSSMGISLMDLGFWRSDLFVNSLPTLDSPDTDSIHLKDSIPIETIPPEVILHYLFNHFQPTPDIHRFDTLANKIKSTPIFSQNSSKTSPDVLIQLSKFNNDRWKSLGNRFPDLSSIFNSPFCLFNERHQWTNIQSRDFSSYSIAGLVRYVNTFKNRLLTSPYSSLYLFHLSLPSLLSPLLIEISKNPTPLDPGPQYLLEGSNHRLNENPNGSEDSEDSSLPGSRAIEDQLEFWETLIDSIPMVYIHVQYFDDSLSSQLQNPQKFSNSPESLHSPDESPFGTNLNQQIPISQPQNSEIDPNTPRQDAKQDPNTTGLYGSTADWINSKYRFIDFFGMYPLFQVMSWFLPNHPSKRLLRLGNRILDKFPIDVRILFCQEFIILNPAPSAQIWFMHALKRALRFIPFTSAPIDVIENISLVPLDVDVDVEADTTPSSSLTTMTSQSIVQRVSVLDNSSLVNLAKTNFSLSPNALDLLWHYLDSFPIHKLGYSSENVLITIAVNMGYILQGTIFSQSFHHIFLIPLSKKLSTHIDLQIADADRQAKEFSAVLANDFEFQANTASNSSEIGPPSKKSSPKDLLEEFNLKFKLLYSTVKRVLDLTQNRPKTTAD